VTTSAPNVRLRHVAGSDFDAIFDWQRDPAACRMAAFIVENPEDRAAFDARWVKILADGAVYERAIRDGEQLVGYVVSFMRFGQREVGYWIDRRHWGKGYGTEGLRLFLLEIGERPLYARAAADNVGSVRVLEKCGFRIIAREQAWARARGAEIEEVVLRLDGE